MLRFNSALLVSLVLSSQVHAQPNSDDRAKLLEFFEAKVRPVFSEHCWSCHGANKQRAGIRLDRKEFVFKKSDVPLVVPGHPEKSLLVRVIRHEGEIKMPEKGKLADQAIADISMWVKLGAVWPEEKTKLVQTDPRAHWAYQPVKKPTLPATKDQTWSSHPVDAFVLAKLEARKLAPNPPAEPRGLIRRAYFDLVGLPPRIEDVEAFIAESSSLGRAAAFERVIDRLLASPQYGERWARHWLDVARYADTKGYVFQEERKYAYAYTYRDYVVKAFNDDLPFDQFILHQLAADRLVAAGQAKPETQAAMGYLTLGRRFLNNIHDITDDRIDAVSRGMLGMTLACARCHDHKYDPISTKDYYGLYGIFTSSIEPKDLPQLGEPADTPEYRAFRKKLQELESAAADYRVKFKNQLDEKNRKNRDELRALEKKVDAFKANSPAAPPRAMVLIDGPNPRDARVLLRGNPGNPGPVAPRQFVSVLAGDNARTFKNGSGRLELAHAIADPNNPLTARVFVNRLWLHHFGAGLVTTPSDFGLRSEPPSHPELLDYLAARFVESGWSIKKMHKLIMLSNTYQLSSNEHPRAREIDADNRLLARANRRRLDFEAMRDSLLFVNGSLDLKMGGAPVDITTAPYSKRRTIYGFIDRQNLPGLFRTFDLASPDATNPQRYQTTVPQQALFMLNHPFVQEQARALVQRTADLKDVSARIDRLHRLLYARSADAEEIRIGERFLNQTTNTEGPKTAAALTPWQRYAQVLMLANEFVFVD